MPLSDVLKGMRQGDYGSKNPSEDNESDGPRMISLTEEEVKGLQEGEPGEQMTLQVSGKLEGNKFNVMSVSSGGGEPGRGEEDEMAQKVMGMLGGAPVMQNQTMPSPS